jgi:hypothetical protein
MNDREPKKGHQMNVHITSSQVSRAHDVAGLAPEAIADLVEATTSAAIGIFPTDLAEEPFRAHRLSGEAADEPALARDVAIFRFASSVASFGVKQVLRRRQADREREAAEREKATRSARVSSR